MYSRHEGRGGACLSSIHTTYGSSSSESVFVANELSLDSNDTAEVRRPRSRSKFGEDDGVAGS